MHIWVKHFDKPYPYFREHYCFQISIFLSVPHQIYLGIIEIHMHLNISLSMVLKLQVMEILLFNYFFFDILFRHP